MTNQENARGGRPNRGSRGSRPAQVDTPSQQRPTGAESQMADAATVAWMLTLMSTLSAEALGLVTRGLALGGGSERLQVLSGTLLLVAVLSGVILLVLTGITLRVRRNPPPRPIVVLSIVSGCLPMVTTALIVSR
ncbi:MAG: hypothetical protein KDA92_05695 [Planctomycetales bacterium]|nr:hypothetical protein [Planctomycetales bacterium]MCA9167157.1 hypothetical protein [Planctomycetales bacterium]